MCMASPSMQMNAHIHTDIKVGTLRPSSFHHRSITTRQCVHNPWHLRRQPPFGEHRSHSYRTASMPRASATAASPRRAAGDSKDVTGLVKALHQAAKDRSISPKEVCAAMIQIEKQKLPTDGWEQMLGGGASPGKRWRLVFTTGTKKVQEAVKGGEGGGRYFPINAVQRWDGETKLIENGIYLGHIASLKFTGPWAMNKKKMDFDFDRITIKLGPWKFGFDLKARQMDEMTRKKELAGGAGPFFLFCYVDDQICVARGRGGGLALWHVLQSALSYVTDYKEIAVQQCNGAGVAPHLSGKLRLVSPKPD